MIYYKKKPFTWFTPDFLQPLPVLKGKFVSWSVGFITDLPLCDGSYAFLPVLTVRLFIVGLFLVLYKKEP